MDLQRGLTGTSAGVESPDRANFHPHPPVDSEDDINKRRRTADPPQFVKKLDLDRVRPTVDFTQLSDRLERAAQAPASSRLLVGQTERSLFSFDVGTLDKFQMPGSQSARGPGGSGRQLRADGAAVLSSSGGGKVPHPPRQPKGERAAKGATLAVATGAGPTIETLSGGPATPHRRLPPLEQPSNALSPRSSGIHAQEVDPDLEMLQSKLGLETGEHAIEFFGCHQSDPHLKDVKVLFFNRPPPSINFRPYDLYIVNRTETNPEYFTMSSAGVVHVRPGASSEFIALGTWWRQSSLFNTIRSIPFFKNYLNAKTYQLWNSNVRYRKYSQIRKQLTKQLFLGKRAFCGALTELSDLCHEMRATPFMSYNSKHVYVLDEFETAQTTQRATAVKVFEGLINKVEDLLQKVCEEVTSRVRPADDITALEGDTSSTVQTKRGEKSKSMQQIKAEALARTRALELARQEVAMLPLLIRLADHMVVESLLIMLLSSTTDFLYSLREQKKTGLFLTTVSIGKDTQSIDFSPTKDEISNMIQAMTDAMVANCNSIPRILYMTVFKPYFRDQSPSGPHLADMIRSSVTFNSVRSDIERVVATDFAKCREYGELFEDYRPIFMYGESFDQDAFANQDHLANSRLIKKEMLKLKQWGNELDRMKLNNVIGIFHVDSKTLRNSLLSIKDRCLDQMKFVLHDVARLSCLQVLQEFHNHIRNLQKKPTSLKEFASCVDQKNTISAEVKNMMASSTTVDDMYRLLGSFDVKIPPQEQVKLDDLHAIHSTFLETLQQAENDITARMPSMSMALDKNISTLDEELLTILATLNTGDAMNERCQPKTILGWLTSVRESIDVIADKADTYSKYQTMFKLVPYEYTNMRAAVSQFEERQLLWSTLSQWEDLTTEWRASEWSSLDPEEMSKEIQTTLKAAIKMYKARDDDRVSLRLKQSVEVWKAYMPCLLDLGNNALRERHWSQIFGKLSMELQETFTLGNLIEWNVFHVADAVSEISGVASGEYALELQLEKIADGWSNMNFTLHTYREYKDIYILAGLDDIFVELEDNQAALQTMLASRFVLGIRDKVETWDKKLSLLSETLDEWLTCQRNWMYLESIFTAPDIQKQLPNETVKFLRVDQNWKDHMRRTFKRPNVIDGACHDHVLQLFQDSNRILEEIQKSLEDYLETKRVSFPRFYFLSNDELLEILSQTRDPRAVKPHLRKCFDSMASVEFGAFTPGARPTSARPSSAKKAEEEELSEEEKEARAKAKAAAEAKLEEDDACNVCILSMSSAEGEVVEFTQPRPCAGSVEFWMLGLESTMVTTLRDHTRASLEAYTEETREVWFFDWPAQSVLTVDQIVWTNNVVDALNAIHNDENPDALVDFKAFSITQIEKMVEVVRGQLTGVQRGCMCNLIVVDVHARDVIERLINEGASKTTDFAWISQLRYYWESPPGLEGDAVNNTELHDCYVKQTNASFNYGYEYLGVQPRLVITPLTDKCFMTLTGALNLILGGAPAGPAGTGKTESVKDLGKALAQQVVVFNCSDGLDYKMMGRFFSGLAQAGAWACFDEFNRIDIEVLSVIAQQILTIQQALKLGRERFEFEGREMSINKHYGCFITMNPGYAGRTELPDNLKALFRPMAMMVPDYALIAEIMLFSEGFKAAKELARKMTSMYRLASEQLSSQDHYDFGMRAVKSVLVMAGTLKRSNPEVQEDLTLIRALRDSNVPKFLADDIPLFTAIVKDLFPGVELQASDYGDIEGSIHERLLEEKLQVVPSLVGKVIQLYETLNVRHGVMLVGVTATGKSTCAKTLGDALTALKKKCSEDGQTADASYEVVNRFTLNPKSITMGELYGEFNLQTNEWTDGLIASIVRQGLASTDTSQKWVICDGPVDAIWIESMNTVLDDNKTLCLNNGERIKLPKTMRMLFEVNDLAVASPATVSRCGMVFLEPVYLGWEPVTSSWVEHVLAPRFPDVTEIASIVKQRIQDFVGQTLDFVRKECRENMASVDMNLVMSFINLFDVMLAENNGITAENVLASLDNIFIFSLVWTLGGNLHDTSLPNFDRFMRRHCKGFELELPSDGLVYDYAVDISATGAAWKPWTEDVAAFKYNSEASFFNLIVPTVDTTRVTFIVERVMEGGFNVLLGGNSGVGKTVIVQQFLADAPQKFTSATKLFSAQTSAANFQAFLEEKLEKLRKNLLGPPSGKTMVVFVDDLNMPQKETYGAQPPVELLRQIINVKDDKQGGFYDRKKVGLFKKVAHTQFIAACAPPGGGRSDVTARLLRHFHMINLPDLSEASMRGIFRSILGGFLGGFRTEFHALVDPTVDASIEVYSRIASELLPTPSKSHYTFNLRDLAKVVQGMLMVEEANLTDVDCLIRLWVHESARVFCDRLVDAADKRWFRTLQRDVLDKHFRTSWGEEVFATVMWGDFVGGSGDKLYAEITDLELANKTLRDFSEDYTLTHNKQMDLVFFRDAIEHVARICRVLRQPRGNALLVGVGGSGRQSLARLASHVAEYKTFQIELTRVYGVNEFHEDVKKVLLHAGCSDKQCVFLINDTQFVKESFLEDINNILNAGEVPDLFAKDEVDKIVNEVRPLAKAAGKILTKDVIYAHFVQLVRENLHIVLAMSPVGDAFRTRLRQFPSLVNCCTIDWYSEWPEDALISVAARFFDEVDLGSPEVKTSIGRLCNVVHTSVAKLSRKFLTELRRHNYTTPTSYLELINLYLAMLDVQRKMNSEKIARYKGGVDKLLSTNEMVGSLKINLQKLAPVLIKASNDTQKLLEEVSRDQAAAQEVEATVQEEAAKVNEAAAEASEIKESAQKDLDEALPAFNGALAALRSLNKNDITEIKSFAKPPPLVQTVMEGVCLLKHEKPDWDNAKKILAKSDFLQSLEEYDKDHIPDKTVKSLQKYIKNPDFQPDVVEKVSKAAKSLCMWVRAMDTYAKVAKNVEPKRKKLASAEKKMSQMSKLLQKKEAELKEVKDRVKALEDKLSDTMQQRDDLQTQSDETAARLERAEQLISGLGDEQVRWQAELEQLDKDRENLVGNILVAAGVIAYGGPFTAQYRDELVKTWVAQCQVLGIPVDANFDLERIIADPVEVREWSLQGLPSDHLSVQNGILMTRGRRWPLMIDPQTQANRWVRNMERPNHLQVIKLTEATYLRTLENCIRVGNPVLLENVEEKLDPALEPVLQKQVFKQAGRMLIRLGDTDVDYSPDFRFYVTSKLPNPHYPPEVCVKVTVINFTVTPKGLEDQLLTQVVGFERPELEEEKGQLVVEISDGQKKLKEIEDKILQMLANATGNILDDHVLIATLGASKTTSQQINEQLEKAEVTKQQIDDACEGYRPVATRGSILYFVVADMGAVDPMYQYSLQYFVQLFSICMEKSPKSNDLAVRVETLLQVCTADIYSNICRGLFERNKRMFSFLISTNIMRHDDRVSEVEWRFFLNRGGLVDESKLPPNPAADWLKKDSWGALQELQQVHATFEGLGSSFMTCTDEWMAWAQSDDPWSGVLPGTWQESINNFQRLLLVRAIREERTVAAITDFILAEIGGHFVESPPFDLAVAYAESSTTTPIIFALSSGADPIGYLIKLAEDMGLSQRLRLISLGQGQGPIAQRLIEGARESGEWVCLQNCHLAASWMGDLERLLEAQSTMKLHDDFRLWLTSMPSKAFPVSVLQGGIKLTNEPPKGLRANVKRTYEDMSEKTLDACTKPQPYKKMLFAVAFFHAVCQERRKFGAIGWNIPYEWTNSDLLTAQANLRMYLDEQEQVPYETLRYVIGQVNYGGRITDLWDQRCAKSILSQYLVPELMDDNYRFTADGVYLAPPEGELESYRAYVDSLPLSDSPEVFGLHKNASITFEQKETKELMTTIISIQPRTGGGAGGLSGDEIVTQLAQDLEVKVPDTLQTDITSADLDEATFAIDPATGSMNSLGTFLLIEIGKFNKLLSRVKHSLKEVQRAMKGLVVMSGDLESMYESLLYGTVPGMWSSVAYLSLKPLGSWISDLSARITFLSNWMAQGPPKAYWVSAFFFPQGFMTATLQTHARLTQIPIDTLDFRTEIRAEMVDDVTAPPDAGVFVYGLYLEGARWDGDVGVIAESLPGELYTAMPIVWLEPMTNEDLESGAELGTDEFYSCPLYKVSSRAGTLSTTGHSTNFVRTLDIPTKAEPDHWVRRGVALLSQLDD